MGQWPGLGSELLGLICVLVFGSKQPETKRASIEIESKAIGSAKEQNLCKRGPARVTTEP